MRRNWLVSSAATAASVALWVLAVSPLPAGEDAIRKKIQGLNDITGRETITTRLQELLDHPETAKKVLAEAKAMLKGSKPAFKYTAAFLLANLAEELKDIATSEPL